MFRPFLKLAVPLAIVALVATSTANGLGALIPIGVAAAVIFVLFHAAKGFEQADRNRPKY